MILRRQCLHSDSIEKKHFNNERFVPRCHHSHNVTGSIAITGGTNTFVVFTLFWFPIVIVIMLNYLPTEIGYDGSGLILLPIYADELAPPLLTIIQIMISLQSIMTVCMALFKPDVQKMVRDLFTTCSCCCCCCCYDDNNNNNRQVDNGSESDTHHNRGTTPS